MGHFETSGCIVATTLDIRTNSIAPFFQEFYNNLFVHTTFVRETDPVHVSETVARSLEFAKSVVSGLDGLTII